MPSTLLPFDPVEQTLVSGSRENTTVPSQALFLLNSPFVRRQALELAKRLQSLDGDDKARIETAYQLVLARKPTELTILEVVNAVDPVQRIESCPLGIAAHGTNLCPLHRRLDLALEAVEAHLAAAPVFVRRRLEARQDLALEGADAYQVAFTQVVLRHRRRVEGDEAGAARGVLAQRGSDGELEHRHGLQRAARYSGQGWICSKPDWRSTPVVCTRLRSMQTRRTGSLPVFNRERCIHCALCDLVCPDYCLVWEDGEKGGRFERELMGVDYRYCKGCMRCVESCPASAMTKKTETPGLAERLRVPLFPDLIE